MSLEIWDNNVHEGTNRRTRATWIMLQGISRNDGFHVCLMHVYHHVDHSQWAVTTPVCDNCDTWPSLSAPTPDLCTHDNSSRATPILIYIHLSVRIWRHSALTLTPSSQHLSIVAHSLAANILLLLPTPTICLFLFLEHNWSLSSLAFLEFAWPVYSELMTPLVERARVSYSKLFLSRHTRHLGDAWDQSGLKISLSK